jgi:hypothetical protein
LSKVSADDRDGSNISERSERVLRRTRVAFPRSSCTAAVVQAVFYIIGPASRLIRRTALTQLAREAEFAERRPTDRGASGGDHRDGRPAEVGW